MEKGDHHSESESSINSGFTPSDTTTGSDRGFAVPWPGDTFMIVEKSSGKAISTKNGALSLESSTQLADNTNRWLCVERNGYFGFQNTRSGKYLGHDGHYGMRVEAPALEYWELIVPRKHPQGGYQLLVPHWWHSLRAITLNEEENGLVTREHGTTTWQFFKVHT